MCIRDRGFGTEDAHVPSETELASALDQADYRTVTLSGNTVNTGGAMLDLGGVVKGYALDRAAENLKANGVQSAIISFGGSIYAVGEKPDGSSYKVGIRDPEGGENDYMATIELNGRFVSTSGTYERGFSEDGVYYHHVLDPATGFPVDNGLVAVTVLSDSGIRSDIYSTALLVMGAEKGAVFAEEHGIDAVSYTHLDVYKRQCRHRTKQPYPPWQNKAAGADAPAALFYPFFIYFTPRITSRPR